MARQKSENRYRSQRPVRRIIITNGDDVHSYTVRPWLAGSLAVFGTVFAAVYLGATAYLIFRDGLIDASTSHTADMQQAYENRIANLRGEIDRIASRQLLDQVAYDQKIEKLLTRQAELTDSQRLIGDLLKTARAEGLEVVPTTAVKAATKQDTASLAPAMPRRSPNLSTAYADDSIQDTINARFDALMGAKADSEPLAIGGPSPELRGAAEPSNGAAKEDRPDLSAMSDQLKHYRLSQYAAVEAIASAAETKVSKARAIMRSIGIHLKLASADPIPTATGEETSDVGGPFVPLAVSPEFVSNVEKARAALEQIGSVRKAVARLPLTEPLDNATITSTFGARRDPFLGRLAMHPGIDYRSPVGRDVPADAPGKVIFAGRNGGYGNMVEIDHGKGLTTRYAHMSRISVSTGDVVAKGDKIGEVGSTGRSTGPHLHYETRVNGEAVDPMIYIQAGEKLASVLGDNS
ncbi:Glycyl-glycine endopeptidase LytM precursor [Hartmannibacter diazotrophicus]|uniref:Glycyl-glycine endopeptidase LytM n=1 Tax=Hartmannibacter diazotrophicus TaxID=1482074 RepID=A0A2C9D865_9HYPH|nr:M23 family metallopeptidase [Hartmannibacter diazotrophicus]SON56507.1 Glycyl-glycine endopeptidase LytM precursor [Hartmannibacter diazotrophicus]